MFNFNSWDSHPTDQQRLQSYILDTYETPLWTTEGSGDNLFISEVAPILSPILQTRAAGDQRIFLGTETSSDTMIFGTCLHRPLDYIGDDFTFRLIGPEDVIDVRMFERMVCQDELEMITREDLVDIIDLFSIPIPAANGYHLGEIKSHHQFDPEYLWWDIHGEIEALNNYNNNKENM